MAESIVKNGLSSIRATRVIAATPAESSGYLAVDFTAVDTVGVVRNRIVSIVMTTGSISNSSGLQLTVAGYTNKTLYLHYYTPKAIQDSTWTIDIYYI